MGKRIVNAYKNLDKDQAYSLKDAVKIVKENARRNGFPLRVEVEVA